MQKLHQHRKHLGSIRLILAGSRQETPLVTASGLEKQQGGEALLAPPEGPGWFFSLCGTDPELDRRPRLPGSRGEEGCQQEGMNNASPTATYCIIRLGEELRRL